ncbi:DNA transfer protein [Rosenbergiella nectarea]|uniref:DNA transfer protein n=1 Tax=Rosenbergiella nectarea TaxID=988801 RepID=UPI001F4E8715|nr:DNA transfer protein [Rosenbergiella nectarea]
MGGIAKGIGHVAGSIVGGVTGSTAAAKAQTNAANQSNATALQIFNQQQATLKPFVQVGLQGLTGLQGTAGQPIDRNATLNSYYNSPEFSQMANQARYQQLASAEATGGLGSTANSNGLAAIAPMLGQNYLNQMTDQQQNMYSQLLGLTNVGLSAGGATNAAAGEYSSAAQNNFNQIGAARAGSSLANGGALLGLAGLGAGLYSGGLGSSASSAASTSSGLGGLSGIGGLGLSTSFRNY